MRHKQQRNEEYTNRKTGAKVPMFQVNDAVCVRRLEHVQKGSPKFTEPLTVIKKVGPSTYLLSDSRKWNASKLPRFLKEALACTRKDNETVFNGLTVPKNMIHNEQEPDLKWGLRVRNPPRWLTDFVR